jgi:hypothetical protein
VLSGLSTDAKEHLFQGDTRLITEGNDCFMAEKYFVAGKQGGISFEFVPEIFIAIFGGEIKCMSGKTFRLPTCNQEWDDHVAVDQLGGRSSCVMGIGQFRSLLENFWPTARIRRQWYLAALVAQPIYNATFMVTAKMGKKGYILDPHSFPSKGQFDPKAFFAVPS